MSGKRKIVEPTAATQSAVVSQLLAEREWMLPALAGKGRRQYGTSSKKMIRHCLLGEPLDATWERPWDYHDLLGVTRTAAAAPAHLQEKAQAVLRQYREWMEADNPDDVRRADEILLQDAATAEGEEA